MSEPAGDLLVADFDYELPLELIAQTPLPERDSSRLLVLDRTSGAIAHSSIRDLPTWLRPGDLLVANNSKVIPARLHARKVTTGGQVELLLLVHSDAGEWTALARPARRLKPGERLAIGESIELVDRVAAIEIIGKGDEGLVRLRFLDGADDRLDEFGSVPLPPYIRARLDDPARYQTVYASVPGSAAAPTAGLHVTPALREGLAANGVGWIEVTLHIGLDTFRPVTEERVEDHRMHSEWCSVTEGAAAAIHETRSRAGRVIALGTTAARTLETLGRHWERGGSGGFTGPTDIFIKPGHQWRLVGGMVTNFHLPRSTLLMMVSGFAGRERILGAYRDAAERRYRFYSFGDAMLIV